MRSPTRVTRVSVSALAVLGALSMIGIRAVPRVAAEPGSAVPTLRGPQPLAMTGDSNNASAFPLVFVHGAPDRLVIYGGIAMVTLLLGMRALRPKRDSASRQSEFVAVLTHQMKTPLSLILLTSDSLAQGRYSSTAMVRDYGRIISDEGRQLTRLIENVLCYARLVDANARYRLDPVDIIELVSESVARFKVQIEHAGCDVHLDLPDAAPPVAGDQTLLRNVLDNLVDNALKHGGSGRYLHISGRADDRFVHLEVTDRGTGIPPEDLSNVFDKFYRGRGAHQCGSGLGLTIANKIVEGHGGKVAVRSDPGRGTTIELRLPVF